MFRPMLAAKDPDLTKLPYPMLASPKLDGIRAMMIDHVMVSRTLKPIPNKAIQTVFKAYAHVLEGLDGELIMGENDNDVYRRTESAVMSVDGGPFDELRWYVFDCTNSVANFKARLEQITKLSIQFPSNVQIHNHYNVTSPTNVMAMHDVAVNDGYEGLILRGRDSFYKQGRSTLKEAGMIKVKVFADSEAIVLGTIPLKHNTNEAKLDNLGLTKRSSHKINKVASGILMGALQVRDLITDVEFELGTGFTADERAKTWPVGTIVKYKHFPHGQMDKPRHPVFLGIRNSIDL